MLMQQTGHSHDSVRRNQNQGRINDPALANFTASTVLLSGIL